MPHSILKHIIMDVTSELAVHLRFSLRDSYRLPNCSPLFTKGLSYLVVLCGLLSVWYYSCRGCTDYLLHLSCCGGGSSSYWHNCTCCWSPGWCPDWEVSCSTASASTDHRAPSLTHPPTNSSRQQYHSSELVQSMRRWLKLKENMAYGPAQSIELKPCEAYAPVQH